MEFIITFLLVLFLIGWVLKRTLPWLLAWYIKRKVEKGEGFGTFGNFGNFGGFAAGGPFGAGADNTRARAEEEVRRSKAQEGKVTVENLEQKEKVIEKNMGEYIDFEEEK